MTNKTFEQVKKANLKTLEMYVPVVARVHGEHHSEFFQVQKVFETIKAKIKAAGSKRPELTEEFASLRSITNNYTIPGDVCESYEAVYNMLSELDNAY